MKKRVTTWVAVVAIGLMGCYGGFNLTNSLYNWNGGISESKWAVWGVFFAFIIIPVYPVTVLVDALVLNSIEFWGGKNPVEKSEGGTTRRVVRAGGEEAVMTYEASTRIIRIERDGEITELRPLDHNRVEVRTNGKAEVWQLDKRASGLRLVGPDQQEWLDEATLARYTGR